MFHTVRRIHRDASLLPPSDSYTGVIRPTSKIRSSASSEPSGSTSNCGWIILNPRPERDASTFPYSATICPGLNRPSRYFPWNQMHFIEVSPWPTVISKMGIFRVRSRIAPRTSPITLAVSPSFSSFSARGFSRSSYRNGKCSNRSSTVAISFSASVFAIAGPMPFTNWTGVSSVSTACDPKASRVAANFSPHPRPH